MKNDESTDRDKDEDETSIWEHPGFLELMIWVLIGISAFMSSY